MGSMVPGKPVYEKLEKQIKQLEQELIESRQILTLSLDLICIADINSFSFLKVNPAFTQILGWSEEALLQRSFLEFVHPDDIKPTQSIVEEKLRLGAKTINFENRYQCRDGSYRWLSWVSHLNLEQGKTYAVARDITDQKQMAKKRDESEKKYRAFFYNAQVALFRISIDGRLIEINKRYAEIAGYDNVDDCMAEYRPKNAWKDPGVRDAFLERIQATGSVRDYEAQIVRKDGTHAWILFSATVSSDQGYIEGSIVNITDRKQVEETIRQSEALKRKMFANIGDVIVIIDKDGINRYKSPNIEKLFGWKPEELVGKRIRENIHPEDLASQRDFFKALMGQANGVEITECRFRCKDGSFKWIEFIGTNLLSDPDICGILGNYHDITNRKAAENALKESEARFKALHNASFGGITIHDKGIILECNQGLSDITGYSADELIGMNGLQLIAEQSRSMVMDKILSGHEKPYEAIGLRKNGGEYPIRMEARNIPYKGKNVRTVEFRDITEQKKAEQEREKLQDQLTQAQKMESVGRLAGGVAHDFNNMLSIILGNTEIILDDMEVSNPFISNLREIQKAAERSADLTRQLLAFARKQTITPQIIDLNRTIKGMLNMLKRLIGEDINLTWHPDKNLWPVKIDPSQIDQILANLCVNAKDAIRGVGKITIETGNTDFDREYCRNHVGFVPGSYALIAVSDNGCGIDKQTTENLFEPFFTTKKIGEGTGLGLSTVYGIVKQNKGFINVYSEVNQGSVFRIYLPKHDGKIKSDGQGNSEKITAGGHETILLVEDEKAILTMVQMMLQRMGYTVLPALTTEEAMRISNEYESGKIHLLMTDVVMPEMNGRDLANTILKRHSDLKCLFMSGYTANVVAHHGILDEGLNFINKPFSKKDLSKKLREILDAKTR